MAEIKKINVGGVDYDIVVKELTKITYAELKALRDNGQLSEGHLYRITDYVTTTAQTETKSAGNVFDVIVLAVSANELSHIARAIQHEGDTYFNDNDLGAWELWYDLDNDTKKYEWADATNGKGVIYRMIDEKRNDCPYDFKNILFYSTKLKDYTTSDKHYYTFSYVVSGKLYDGTVNTQVITCHSNSMGVYITKNKKTLNSNVFRNSSFGQKCCGNTFGFNCQGNTFGFDCYANIFGKECILNTFDYACHDNTFGNHCSANTFDDNCHANIFGYLCQSNIFGESCSKNIFGNHCGSTTFGKDCNYNIIGNLCSHNTFGKKCHSNIFGNSCYENILSNNCSYNTFGSGVIRRRLDEGQTSITLRKTSFTINEEYYDDGSGQLVPVKHPDLSTQPSILPYKFMGQYVYEQLIPYQGSTLISKSILATDKPLFLEASAFGTFGSFPCEVVTLKEKDVFEIEKHNKSVDIWDYFKIVYTLMPEEGSYYGYNEH